MNKKALIEKIKEKAKQDKKNRADRRFLDVMGLLIAKGFLKTNLPIFPLPNKRLYIEDAIWAGQNVEPRILEVLPAAVLRLGKHFEFNPGRHKELVEILAQLRKRESAGPAFFGIPYSKVRIWTDFPLRDKRVKSIEEKKVVRTFRMNPLALTRLRQIAKEKGTSETSVIEQLILGS